MEADRRENAPVAGVRLPDWRLQPLDPSAPDDQTTSGCTELRCHGVSGPLPGSVLRYPEELVTLVDGNPDSGFWRRWRLGGPDQDLPGERRIEAFCWGGLTSRASIQALWLLLIPFALVNLAHWMLLPWAGRGAARAARVAVVLLRVLALSLTLTMLLAGAEMTMDISAWQCGAVSSCRSQLGVLGLIGMRSAQPGVRLGVAALVLTVILLLLWRAGLARFRPLEEPANATRPVVAAVRRRDVAEFKPVLGDPAFWAVDRSTQWLRGLHVLAWCAGTAAILAAVLRSQLPAGGAAGEAARVLLVISLVTLGVIFALVLLPERFGRGGAGPIRTTGLGVLVGFGLILLVAAIVLMMVAMPATADPGGARLPWLQGALGRLIAGQAVVLLLLAGCTGWLAVAGRRHDRRQPGYRPMLGGLLALVTGYLAWLVGLVLSAGVGLVAAGGLGEATSALSAGPARPGGPIRLLVPPVYSWIEAGAVAAVAILVAGIIVLVFVVAARARAARTAVAADEELAPGGPGTVATPGGLATPGSGQAAAKALRSAGRAVAVAQSIDSLPVLLGAVTAATFAVLVIGVLRYPAAGRGMAGWFPASFATVTTAGAWLATAGTTALIGFAYAAYRSQTTRRTAGIIWDITTFWPKANHPLVPACTAERSVPQLADRIGQLTPGGRDRVVLSGHSQGSVLSAAAMLRLGQDPPMRSRLSQVALLTYGAPLRRLYARCFPAYFSADVFEQVAEDVGGSWLNLWARSDPIGGWIRTSGATGSGGAAGSPLPGPNDWRMSPEPLTLGVDLRTGEQPGVCGHSGYLSRPEYPAAIGWLRRLSGSATLDEGRITRPRESREALPERQSSGGPAL